ncbi:MAG: MarR family transcriptional regulator [Crocinitomix sp.]|nr:MarR family transcriptional regulator [Crocinitomix sp.]
MKRIEEVILFQIEQTSKASKQYSQREFDRLGISITVEQWILLKIISESTDLTQKELALKSSRDPASITRTLDLLQKKEYITREKVPNNRRSYFICLTKKGAKFINEHMGVVSAQREKSVEGFTQEQLIILSNMLTRIRQNME